MPNPTLRVARATDNIAALLPFYRDGLGLSVLGRFEDHAGPPLAFRLRPLLPPPRG